MDGERRPLDCARVGERTAAYVYGDLPAEEAESLEAHARDCAGCRQALEASFETVRMLDAFALPETRPTDLDSLSLRPRPARAPRAGLGLRRLAAAAVLMFLVGGALAGIGVELETRDGSLSVHFGARRASPEDAAESPSEPPDDAARALASTPELEALRASTAELDQRVALLQDLVLDLAERHERDLVQLAMAVDRTRRVFLEELLSSRSAGGSSASTLIALPRPNAAFPEDPVR